MVALSIDTADCGYSDPVDVWQRLLSDYLAPFEVVPAPDIPFRGQMSLSTLGPVDVVVSDYLMPRLNGIQETRLARA